MALGTLTKVDAWVEGNKRVRVYDVQLPASYTTGGDSLTPAMVGLRKIIAVNALGPAQSSTPTSFQVGYDYTNQKLIAYGQAVTTGAAVAQIQVTSTTNLSTFTVRLEIIGY